MVRISRGTVQRAISKPSRLSCRQEVLIEDTPDLDLQDGILLGARRQPGGITPFCDMGMIGRGGDRQNLADRLDPMRRAPAKIFCWPS